MDVCVLTNIGMQFRANKDFYINYANPYFWI